MVEKEIVLRKLIEKEVARLERARKAVEDRENAVEVLEAQLAAIRESATKGRGKQTN